MEKYSMIRRHRKWIQPLKQWLIMFRMTKERWRRMWTSTKIKWKIAKNTVVHEALHTLTTLNQSFFVLRWKQAIDSFFFLVPGIRIAERWPFWGHSKEEKNIFHQIMAFFVLFFILLLKKKREKIFLITRTFYAKKEWKMKNKSQTQIHEGHPQHILFSMVLLKICQLRCLIVMSLIFCWFLGPEKNIWRRICVLRFKLSIQIELTRIKLVDKSETFNNNQILKKLNWPMCTRYNMTKSCQIYDIYHFMNIKKRCHRRNSMLVEHVTAMNQKRVKITFLEMQKLTVISNII